MNAKFISTKKDLNLSPGPNSGGYIHTYDLVINSTKSQVHNRLILDTKKRDNYLSDKKLSLGFNSGGAFRTYDLLERAQSLYEIL